jgi:phage recombination protein Bet
VTAPLDRPSADLAVVAPTTGALALRADQHEWSPEQHAALAQIGVADAPAGDQAVFLHVCQRTGLDPFSRQIYMIARKERGWNGEQDRVKWTIQTGIDGFRLIAERHPQYAGTLDPEWCGDDGVWRTAWVGRQPPVAARVKVLRHDRAYPITLPVRFVEFAATNRDGSLQGQWKTKQAHMIAKVAEAAALRKAFPLDLSGMYVPEEMDHENAGHSHSAPGIPPRGAVPAVTVDELTGGRAAAAPDPHPGWPPPDPPIDVPPEDIISGAVEDEPAVGDDVPARGDLAKAVKAPTAQLRLLHKLIRDAEVIRRGDRLELAGYLVGEPIDTFDTLNVDQATRAIDGLMALQDSDNYPAAVAAYVRTWRQRRAELDQAARPDPEQDPRDDDPGPGDPPADQ